MSNIHFNLTPFNEEELQGVIKRLACIFASEMGWFPKSLANKGSNASTVKQKSENNKSGDLNE